MLSGYSANAQWITTPSPLSSYRHDDAYFLDPDRGWAINFSTGSSGYIIKTSNGGSSWVKLIDSTGAKYRDIAFLDSLTGFVGTLETGYNPEDTVIMYQTIDGGTSWNAVSNFPGPRPAGICGMSAVTDSILVACGRYFGPAGFYKTIDKGTTWTYQNMDTLAAGLVDIHFFDKDIGIAVGGTHTDVSLGKGRVLKTTDGGVSWTIVHTSAHTKEICWKISFPSANIGYISLQSFRGSGPQYFLKTTDGGNTWQDIQFLSGGSYNAQGIGFLTDSIGWIGGDVANYKTINGGLTWSVDAFGSTVNRFRFFGDTLAYAAGKYIYKHTAEPVGIAEPALTAADLSSVFPNPFTSSFTLVKKWAPGIKAHLNVYDCMGRRCYSQQLNQQPEEVISVSALQAGLYFYEINLSNGLSVIGKIFRE
jgi:photosystem II stability/assembly factor-like uncharacterized protein